MAPIGDPADIAFEQHKTGQRQRIEHAQRRARHFGTDPVTGQNCDLHSVLRFAIPIIVATFPILVIASRAAARQSRVTRSRVSGSDHPRQAIPQLSARGHNIGAHVGNQIGRDRALQPVENFQGPA